MIWYYLYSISMSILLIFLTFRNLKSWKEAVASWKKAEQLNEMFQRMIDDFQTLEKERAKMMEKYGANMAEIPATESQIEEIRKIATDLGVSFILPKSREEADKILLKLKENNENGPERDEQSS